MASTRPLVYRDALGHAARIADTETLGLPVAAADPTGAVAGESYWNSVLKCIRTYDGAAWTGAPVATAGADESFVYFMS